MSDSDRQRRVERYIEQSAPLAPMCRKYINLETLGISDRLELTKAFEGIFGDTSTNQGSWTSPRNRASERTGQMDNVTVNIIHTALRNGVLTQEHLSYMSSRTDDRHYALMELAVQDIVSYSGTRRQYHGLHDAADRERIPLDLSTDDQYIRYSALMRYSTLVTSSLRASEKRNRLVSMFDYRGGDICIPTKIREVIWNSPESADMLARYVIERERQDHEELAAIVRGETATALLAGQL